MILERALGAGAVLVGGYLLLFGIPANVAAGNPARLMTPQLFPQIAAWLILGLGLVQVVLGSTGANPPPRREVGRLLLLLAVTLASLFAMSRLGFVATMAALMVAVQLIGFERRPVWLIVTIIAVPVGIWLFFDVLLGRPLP